MNNIKIEKIGDHYKVDRNSELEDLIISVMDKITYGKSDLMFEANNTFLVENMISRVICSKFIENKIELPETGYTLVEVNYCNDIITVSVGILDINGEKKYVCGVWI